MKAFFRALLTLRLLANVVENHAHSWVIVDISVDVHAHQAEKHCGHRIVNWILDATWFVWHDALNKGIYSCLWILQQISDRIDELYLNALISSQLVGIVCPWRVNQGHVASRGDSHHRCHWFNRLCMLKGNLLTSTSFRILTRIDAR